MLLAKCNAGPCHWGVLSGRWRIAKDRMAIDFTHDLNVQANATRRQAEREGVHPGTKATLLAAAETLDSLKRLRDRKKAEAETYILTLPDNATPKEIRHARQRHAVRHGADVYLPLWQAGTFALPNALIRSGLFSVASKPVTDDTERTIGTQGATAIKLAGCLLDYDRQVFAAVLSLAKDSPLAEADSPWIQVSYWEMAQAMGVPYGTTVQAAIRKSLNRLNSARIRIRVNKLDIKLSQLVEIEFKKVAKRKSSKASKTEEPAAAGEEIAFRVPQPVAELFGHAAWTKVPAFALTGYSGLARWLATYYSSHAKPYAVSLEDMLGFTGSTCAMPEFKRRLKLALEKLQKAETPDEIRVEAFVLNAEKGVLTVYLSRWDERLTMSPEEKEFAGLK